MGGRGGSRVWESCLDSSLEVFWFDSLSPYVYQFIRKQCNSDNARLLLLCLCSVESVSPTSVVVEVLYMILR